MLKIFSLQEDFQIMDVDVWSALHEWKVTSHPRQCMRIGRYVARYMGSCEGNHESKDDEDDSNLCGTRDSLNIL